MGKRAYVLGSANIVDVRRHQFEPIRKPLNFSDPSNISELLGATEIAEEAFPVVTTGVRYWPWLLVARDFSGRYKQTRKAMLRLLPAIRRRVNRTGVFAFSRLGPTSIGTFGYYRSMYKKIADLPESNPIKRFIEDARRQFDGSQVHIFERSEGDWRRALSATDGTSRAAHQFAQQLNRLKRRDGLIDGPEKAITYILKHYRRFDARLWKACFCYSAFRCLYGIADPNQEGEGGTKRKASKHELHREWARLLVSILDAKPKGVRPEWYRLRRHIKVSVNSFGKVYEQEDQRRVLRTFRFYTFFYLHSRSVPRAARDE